MVGVTAIEEHAAWWMVVLIIIAGALASFGAAYVSRILAYRVLMSKWTDKWTESKTLGWIPGAVYITVPVAFIIMVVEGMQWGVTFFLRN